MISAKLLDILNNANQPNEILARLEEEKFAVTDVTENGDSILHVLAQSEHTKKGDFSDYLRVLMAAGANPNALDKQGNSFLSYCLMRAPSYSVGKTFDLLLDHKGFDVNQTSETGQTFFEFIYSSKGYNLDSTFSNLIKHKEFNPNQKTSKHNSVVLHMISEEVFQFREHIYAVIRHPATDPNIKNKNEQTALAQLLSAPGYKNMELITALINHEQCDIDALDQDGNTYLQLAIISSQYQAADIALLLIKKGIDVTHKNKKGQSVFDLIAENKANRSEYVYKTLYLAILKLHPSSFFEKDSSGRTILGGLLRSVDYTITSEFKTVLELCKNQKNNSESLKEIILDCFNDFSQNLLSSQVMESLTNVMIEARIDIDVEHCLALTAMGSPSVRKEEIYSNLRKMSPELNISALISHVKSLTKEWSVEEKSRVLGEVNEIGFHLDCFDDDMLAFEEKNLRTKTKSGIEKDTKMFGHLFSLGGSIPVHKGLVKLTGGTSTYSAPFLAHLMNSYVSYCETSGKHSKHLDAIKQVRNMTIKAMRYYFLNKTWGEVYYPSIRLSKIDIWSSMVADSKKSGVEVITGWPGHAISLVIKDEDFYRNNGGGCSTDATTEHYTMSMPEKLTEQVFATLYMDSEEEANKTYIQRNLHQHLGLIFNSFIKGKFQTVGNCSLQSRLIALKVKYRLFLSDEIADELFADTIQFFEEFYLAEYLSFYSNSATLPHLLMRLIIQELVPEKKLEQAGKLLKDHFTSETAQEIMQVEFMLQKWKLKLKGGSMEQFDTQLLSLGVALNPKMNNRLQMLDRFLNDKVTSGDLVELKSWSLDEQMFQGYHLLHFAVRNNNLSLASSLIQLFPHAVNQTNWFDQEPLCLVRSVEMIDLLVKSGASTARTDYDNALDYAIIANNVDMVHALIKHGAKPSEYSAYYAANKDPKILQAIIEYCPETMNKTTHNYSTPVHAAARGGHTENLRTLVYYGGVSPGSADVNGITPLQLALQNEHKETAKTLIQYPGTLFMPSHRGEPVVSMTKDSELRKEIEFKKEETQADLEYFEKFKNSKPGIIEEEIDYLIVAIRKNDVQAIRGCLLAHPKIKVVASSGLYSTTPLTEAIKNLAGNNGDRYNESLEIVKMLLKTPGIDINACMPSTEPIMFMATSIGNVDVLELFLADPKLNPNKQDNIGYTALHDAVERDHLDCVKRLLKDDRVDSTIMNKRKQTAADLKGFKFRDNGTQCQEEVLRHQENMQTNKQGMIIIS